MPKEYQERVLKLLRRFKDNPLEEYDVKKLRGFENVFRVRIGKYRAVYKVDRNRRKAFADFIGHRGKAY